MPSLSRYGAAGAQSKKFSRRLGKASEYGSLADTAKETGARTQKAIADTLESIKKIAGTVGEVRKEVKFGEEVEDIARGAYGIDTKTEKGFLGIPKTTYTEADTGKALSAMDIYAYGKYGEGTAKHERLFGEEAARERGMKEVAAKQEVDIAAAEEYYGKRKSVHKDLVRKGMIPSGAPVGEDIVADDSAYVTRGVKPDALEGGAVVEEAYVEGSQYSAEDLERIKAGRSKSSLTPKVSQPTLDPSRKEPEETEKFEAVPMNVAEPSSTDVFRPPDKAMSQMKAPDFDLFGGEASLEQAFTSGEIERLIGAESGGLTDAVSSTGRVGAMQISKATAADPGYGVKSISEADLASPEGNIGFGKDYLEAMYKKFGSKDKALAAYLLGPGTAQRDYFPLMSAARPEAKVGGETFGSVQQYIDRVLGRSALGTSYQDEEKILSRVRTNYGGMY